VGREGKGEAGRRRGRLDVPERSHTSAGVFASKPSCIFVYLSRFLVLRVKEKVVTVRLLPTATRQAEPQMAFTSLLCVLAYLPTSLQGSGATRIITAKRGDAAYATQRRLRRSANSDYPYGTTTLSLQPVMVRPISVCLVHRPTSCSRGCGLRDPALPALTGRLYPSSFPTGLTSLRVPRTTEASCL